MREGLRCSIGCPQSRRPVGKMATPKKRITLQSLEEDGARVTALCGATLQETREQVGKKLGFEKPSLCRLFNKHGAEIDHMDLVMHDDLLYASAGGPFPRNMKTRPSASHGMSSMPRRVRLLILVPLLLTSCAQPQVCRVWRRA